MKANKHLKSEQLPNDGGWHVDRLMSEANERLGRIGKHGKRAKIRKTKSNLQLQFSWNGKQKPWSLNLVLSAKNIEKAEEYAAIVTGQLVAGTFTPEWFYSLIGKPIKTTEEKQLTCEQMLEEYKAHFFKEKENLKRPRNAWYQAYRHLESVLSENKQNFNAKTIKAVIESTKIHTDARKRLLGGLINFCGYFERTEFNSIIEQYKKNNKPESKTRKTPDSSRIIEVYKTGFEPSLKSPYAKRHRHSQWQFLYGLLAAYGLRVHEAWNIANWDKPVVLRDGDWVTVVNQKDEDVSEQYTGRDVVIPAILDPDNKEHILCIGHDTKTGYRMAMPLSPKGHDWIKEFNLLQPLNLPDIKDPLKFTGGNDQTFSCSNSTCEWFLRQKYGFTPHGLRHAYNHRGHNLGINPTALCQSLGHGIQMNSTTYLNTMPDSVRLEGMLDTIRQDREKRNELEIAQDRIKELEIRVKELETELRMYKAISESKSS